MIKTNNFNPTTDPKLLCTCGHKECDKRSVTQDTLDMMETVRVNVGRPLTVTSGGRCTRHPNELHRTTPADHQKGQALDIFVRNGLERGQLVEVGILCGFNAIGVAKSFVHLGYRHELCSDQLVMWVY
jgi:zinc D-Ala-D-Ala carboxypeptidase